ncbi:hypothetical protein AB0L49_31475 [Streptomyces antimycoticus]|uniref:Uncharacterized protein n=1 Tax=Streptomyces antimycoticus TaxID=68175 RepID=A0A499UI41_9ACTN|nr:hypothetical protein [Streptomyces antimycoticus]BBJ41243.1 hypothetical protein SSPO_039610 [Streptomyces antimycoticus]
MVNGWDVAAAVGTVASAAAAAVATGLVAWQARLARRANASAHAVVIDSAKARLDAEAPDLDVRALAPAWPPLSDAQDSASLPTRDTVWSFPGDERKTLVCTLAVELTNRGTRDVEVTIHGDVRPVNELADPAWQPGRPIEDFLMPGREPYRFHLQGTLTLRQWADNQDAQGQGRPLPHRIAGAVIATDRRDEGITDRWELVMTGCPIERVPGAADQWRLTTDSAVPQWKILTVEPVARERTYWISRRRGLEYPSVEDMLN